MRRTHVVILGLLALLNAGSKLDRLTDAEYGHYRALRVYMDDKERKGFLKLKTTEERDQWLKDAGLWDKFYQHPESLRQSIIEGDVEIGWTREMVYMAWGAPFQKQRLTGRPAGRSELLVYRFEIDKDGVAAPMVGKKTDYKAVGHKQIDLIVDDDIVTEMQDKGDYVGDVR